MPPLLESRTAVLRSRTLCSRSAPLPCWGRAIRLEHSLRRLTVSKQHRKQRQVFKQPRKSGLSTHESTAKEDLPCSQARSLFKQILECQQSSRAAATANSKAHTCSGGRAAVTAVCADGGTLTFECRRTSQNAAAAWTTCVGAAPTSAKHLLTFSFGAVPGPCQATRAPFEATHGQQAAAQATPGIQADSRMQSQHAQNIRETLSVVFTGRA